jgi:hypothetical protein
MSSPYGKDLYYWFFRCYFVVPELIAIGIVLVGIFAEKRLITILVPDAEIVAVGSESWLAAERIHGFYFLIGGLLVIRARILSSKHLPARMRPASYPGWMAAMAGANFVFLSFSPHFPPDTFAKMLMIEVILINIGTFGRIALPPYPPRIQTTRVA